MSFNDYKFSPVSLIEMIPIVSQIYMGYIYSHKISQKLMILSKMTLVVVSPKEMTAGIENVYIL